MKDLKYYVQLCVTVALGICYVFGGLYLLFPNGNYVITSLGAPAVGIMLLITGLFGSPYPTLFKTEEH